MSNATAGGATATGVKTAAFQAKAASGRLLGVSIMPTGAVTPIVTIYDNASASSGTKLFETKIASGVYTHFWFGPEGINASNGIRMDADSFTTLGVNTYYA